MLPTLGGKHGTNPVPRQALELHNRLIETRLYLQGLLTTEAPLLQWLLQSLIPLQLCQLSAAITTLQKLILPYFTGYGPEPTRFFSIAPYKISGDFRKKKKKPQRKALKKKKKGLGRL